MVKSNRQARLLPRLLVPGSHLVGFLSTRCHLCAFLPFLPDDPPLHISLYRWNETILLYQDHPLGHSQYYYRGYRYRLGLLYRSSGSFQRCMGDQRQLKRLLRDDVSGAGHGMCNPDHPLGGLRGDPGLEYLRGDEVNAILSKTQGWCLWLLT